MKNNINYCPKPGKLVRGLVFVKFAVTSAVKEGMNSVIHSFLFCCFPQETLSVFFLWCLFLKSGIFDSPSLYGRGDIQGLSIFCDSSPSNINAFRFKNGD